MTPLEVRRPEVYLGAVRGKAAFSTIQSIWDDGRSFCVPLPWWCTQSSNGLV